MRKRSVCPQVSREYSIQGRWASPDPAGLATVDPSNPQSWNRYGYVQNSPLNLADPLGLFQYIPCAPGNPPCLPDTLGGGGGGWGFPWPCFGFLSTGPGPGCAKAPPPPQPAAQSITPKQTGAACVAGSTASGAVAGGVVGNVGGGIVGGVVGGAIGGGGGTLVAPGVGTIGGAAAGASTGVSVGSAVGTGVGALVGAGLGYLVGNIICAKGGQQNIVPTWAEGQRPLPGESGKDFAKRLCDERYGPGNYDTGPGSEYNKLKKWGDAHPAP